MREEECTITVVWHKVEGKVDWHLQGVSYLQAVWLLTDIVRRCAEFALQQPPELAADNHPLEEQHDDH